MRTGLTKEEQEKIDDIRASLRSRNRKALEKFAGKFTIPASALGPTFVEDTMEVSHAL